MKTPKKLDILDKNAMTRMKKVQEQAIRLFHASALTTSIAFSAMAAPPESQPGALVVDKDYSTAQLALSDQPVFLYDSLSGEPYVVAFPAVIGPVEKIDLPANKIIVAGQPVGMDQLQIDDYALGEYVRIDGTVSANGITAARALKLAAPYVYGSSLTYLETFILHADANSANANAGGTELDFSNALSRSLKSSYEVTRGAYVRTIGIQTQIGSLVAADLQAFTQHSLGGEIDRTAPIGGDLSEKVNIDGNLAGKAIIGGNRSGKAIIGGNRTGKVIIGGNRSGKAIIGGNRTGKVIIGGNRSGKAIIGGNRTGKVIIGGNRSGKAIIGGNRTGKVIIGGNRTSKTLISGDESPSK